MTTLSNEELLTVIAAITTLLSTSLKCLYSCQSIVTTLIEEYNRNQTALQNLITERNKMVRRYIRRKERFINRRARIYWIKPGRTGQWWDNLRDNKMPADEWRKNLRMNVSEFQNLVDLLYPYLAPSENAVRIDSLTVAKKVALCLYYLKDQGGYRMACNAFGVSVATLSVILPQFCNTVIKIGKNILRLPKTAQ